MNSTFYPAKSGWQKSIYYSCPQCNLSPHHAVLMPVCLFQPVFEPIMYLSVRYHHFFTIF